MKGKGLGEVVCSKFVLNLKNAAITHPLDANNVFGLYDPVNSKSYNWSKGATPAVQITQGEAILFGGSATPSETPYSLLEVLVGYQSDRTGFAEDVVRGASVEPLGPKTFKMLKDYERAGGSGLQWGGMQYINLYHNEVLKKSNSNHIMGRSLGENFAIILNGLRREDIKYKIVGDVIEIDDNNVINYYDISSDQGSAEFLQYAHGRQMVRECAEKYMRYIIKKHNNINPLKPLPEYDTPGQSYDDRMLNMLKAQFELLKRCPLPMNSNAGYDGLIGKRATSAGHTVTLYVSEQDKTFYIINSIQSKEVSWLCYGLAAYAHSERYKVAHIEARQLGQGLCMAYPVVYGILHDLGCDMDSICRVLASRDNDKRNALLSQIDKVTTVIGIMVGLDGIVAGGEFGSEPFVTEEQLYRGLDYVTNSYPGEFFISNVSLENPVQYNAEWYNKFAERLLLPYSLIMQDAGIAKDSDDYAQGVQRSRKLYDSMMNVIAQSAVDVAAILEQRGMKQNPDIKFIKDTGNFRTLAQRVHEKLAKNMPPQQLQQPQPHLQPQLQPQQHQSNEIKWNPPIRALHAKLMVAMHNVYGNSHMMKVPHIHQIPWKEGQGLDTDNKVASASIILEYVNTKVKDFMKKSINCTDQEYARICSNEGNKVPLMMTLEQYKAWSNDVVKSGEIEDIVWRSQKDMQISHYYQLYPIMMDVIVRSIGEANVNVERVESAYIFMRDSINRQRASNNEREKGLRQPVEFPTFVPHQYSHASQYLARYIVRSVGAYMKGDGEIESMKRGDFIDLCEQDIKQHNIVNVFHTISNKTNDGSYITEFESVLLKIIADAVNDEQVVPNDISVVTNSINNPVFQYLSQYIKKEAKNVYEKDFHQYIDKDGNIAVHTCMLSLRSKLDLNGVVQQCRDIFMQRNESVLESKKPALISNSDKEIDLTQPKKKEEKRKKHKVIGVVNIWSEFVDAVCNDMENRLYIKVDANDFIFNVQHELIIPIDSARELHVEVARVIENWIADKKIAMYKRENVQEFFDDFRAGDLNRIIALQKEDEMSYSLSDSNRLRMENIKRHRSNLLDAIQLPKEDLLSYIDVIADPNVRVGNTVMAHKDILVRYALGEVLRHILGSDEIKKLREISKERASARVGDKINIMGNKFEIKDGNVVLNIMPDYTIEKAIEIAVYAVETHQAKFTENYRNLTDLQNTIQDVMNGINVLTDFKSTRAHYALKIQWDDKGQANDNQPQVNPHYAQPNDIELHLPLEDDDHDRRVRNNSYGVKEFIISGASIASVSYALYRYEYVAAACITASAGIVALVGGAVYCNSASKDGRG